MVSFGPLSVPWALSIRRLIPDLKTLACHKEMYKKQNVKIRMTLHSSQPEINGSIIIIIMN